MSEAGSVIRRALHYAELRGGGYQDAFEALASLETELVRLRGIEEAAREAEPWLDIAADSDNLGSMDRDRLAREHAALRSALEREKP